MLKQIKIENYRSCLQTSLDLDTNMSVLIGANGSGKTNILQAIMLLNKMVNQEYYQRKAVSVTINPHLRCKFASNGYETRLWASVDAYTDESNTDVILSSKERWTVKDANGKAFRTSLPLAVIDPGSPRPHFLYQRTVLRRLRFRGVVLHPDLAEIPKSFLDVLVSTRSFAKGIKYYGASQFTNPGSCPVSFEIEEDGDESRLFRRRGHLRILYDMYLAKESKTSKGHEQFLDTVGPRGLKLIDGLTFRKVETSSMEYSVRVGGKVEPGRKHKLLIVPQFRIGKQRLSPNQLSEGTFKTLALLFHIITADSTALLIEEPEVCVHQGLLSSILELVQTYSKRKLMIISTHSDYVLDHVAPENVHIVTTEKGAGTTVRNIRKTMDRKEYSALRNYLRNQGNLGEYWRETGFGGRP